MILADIRQIPGHFFEARIAFLTDLGNGRSPATPVMVAGTGQSAPIRPLRELGYVSVLQRISRSPPGDSIRRGTLRELALMPVD